MAESRKIALIYIDAGGGHRAAATALCEVIREQQRPWQVEMFSIQDLLNSIDFVRKCTGIPFQDVYNIMLRRGWTLGTAGIAIDVRYQAAKELGKVPIDMVLES